MVTQQHLASFKRADRDLYAREEVLNSAIIAADINLARSGERRVRPNGNSKRKGELICAPCEQKHLGVTRI